MKISPPYSFSGQIKYFNLILSLFYMLNFCCTILAAENGEYIMVKVISRPIIKENEINPRTIKGQRHLAIISNIFPHGIWEMGPDAKGMIATTNTVENLSEWHTYQVTQKCIVLGGDYIFFIEVEVNKEGLLSVIKLYEDSFAGKHRYSFRSYNENWAVEKAIYGAGGDLVKTDFQKGKPYQKSVTHRH